jgi:hypothetical protein
MHRSLPSCAAVFVFALGLLHAGDAQSGPASPQLRGKSVIVSWMEHRSQRRVGKADFRARTVRHELRVYVSTEGRAFNRMTNRNRSGTASNDQVAGAGGGRNFDFGGQTMTAFTGGKRGGARRIAVEFDSGFSSCRADVIRAKEAGAASFVTRSRVTGMMVEIRSVSVDGISCAVRSGNVFAGD